MQNFACEAWIQSKHILHHFIYKPPCLSSQCESWYWVNAEFKSFLYLISLHFGQHFSKELYKLDLDPVGESFVAWNNISTEQNQFKISKINSFFFISKMKNMWNKVL